METIAEIRYARQVRAMERQSIHERVKDLTTARDGPNSLNTLYSALYWALCERMTSGESRPTKRGDCTARWVCTATKGDREPNRSDMAIWAWARAKVSRYCREHGIRAPRSEIK